MPIEETLCPDCNGPMISRKSQYGVFWGCKDYPKCKGTRDSMGRSKADIAKWKKEQGEEIDDSPVEISNDYTSYSFKKGIK